MRESGQDVIIMARRQTPLKATSETLFEGDIKWGQSVEIPQEYRSSLIVADVTYAKSWRGRLQGFIRRPPRVIMAIERVQSDRATIRLNPLISPMGVVVAARDGHWGAESPKIHENRHAPLTEVESQVESVSFFTRVLNHDANAMFGPTLRLHLKVVSLTD
jgi:hypothetical protein